MLKYYCADISLLEEQKIFDQWLEKMNIQRREKVLCCKNQIDKQRSLMAGILLRIALEKEGLSYEKLEFSKTAEGKPFLSSNPGIHFSITHSGDYVGCAVAEEPVGVDIEHGNKRLFEKEKRFKAVAKKCLSKAEWDRFLTSSDKKKLFLEYWTKKEAFSKAKGKGLGMAFSEIDTETDAIGYWSVWTSDGYCVSIYKEDGNYRDLYIEKIKSL